MNLQDLAKKRSTWVAVGVVVVVGVVLAWTSSSKKSKPLVQVGDITIFERDVDARLALLRVQNPNAPHRAALDQLVRTYTRHQILKMVGMPVTEEMIEQERQRVLKSAANAAHLDKVISVLGKNTDGLRRAFLIPMIVDRVLYTNYFQQRVPEQVEARKKADAFHQAYTKDPKGAIAGAAKLGYTVTHATVTQEEGMHWDPEPTLKAGVAGPEPRPPASLPAFRPNPVEGRVWFGTLSKVKEGEVGPMRDYGEHWYIFRVLSHNTKGTESYRVQIVKAPKVSFEGWVKTQEPKISVKQL